MAIDASREAKIRCSARSENPSGELFGVASRGHNTVDRDGSLIAAHNNVMAVMAVMGPAP